MSTFEQDVEKMFDRFDRQVDEICVVFVVRTAAMVISTTPGPNLQYPLTEYIATGRLRGAWTYGWSPLGAATRYEGGPYTEHGDDTLAVIEAQVRSRPIAAISYLRNDVAYGYFVHEGLFGHAHIGPRPWVEATAAAQQSIADAARREVMRRVA